MGSSIFFGGSVVAAVVAGMVSLFVPCCVSVMLPAYFASSFHNKRLRVAMTFVFAAGIATVLQDIGHRITRSLSWLPPWASWLAFAAIVSGLATVAVRQLRRSEVPVGTTAADTTETAVCRLNDSEPASDRTLEETRI